MYNKLSFINPPIHIKNKKIIQSLVSCCLVLKKWKLFFNISSKLFCNTHSHLSSNTLLQFLTTYSLHHIYRFIFSQLSTTIYYFIHFFFIEHLQSLSRYFYLDRLVLVVSLMSVTRYLMKEHSHLFIKPST